tara:strand:- start:909 stop:1547 length:639 start_codon:yes stop_codon:yes gene_type:complete
MNLTQEQKQDIGRRVRAENSGPKELQICELYGLTQIGGSRTKVDGQHSDGSHWSIKNANSSSTQVHLTSKSRFIEDFALSPSVSNFVDKFFGDLTFTDMPRQRYRMDEISSQSVADFKLFLENNKKEVIEYFISGKFNIEHLVYNRRHLTFEEIMDQVADSSWVYKPTTVHLKNPDGKTLFHIQMKGSGKGKVYHGVLCHIHENLFLQKDQL